jgi:ADP-heptose:LPS heptosyltransferase
MAAVIRRLAVLISTDSGPAHLAYAAGTPTVTLFGGTDPGRWGPPVSDRHQVVCHTVACRPCQGDHCPIGFACLAAIGVDEVVQAAKAVMG